MRRVAILGAGISGLTTAWQLTRPASGEHVAVTLFEATGRTGGIVDTVREDGFVLELGPDSWVTEKPAARELAEHLGLGPELLASNDATRKTHLLLGTGAEARLIAMPDGLRMMVPIGRAALPNLDQSPLFSSTARQAFRDEFARADDLRRSAPLEDESIASFTERHFGREVLERLAAPLLSGVFGGDVNTLSVRAVMAPFVAMERQHGSLIAALEEREAERAAAGRAPQPLFTTLRSGLGRLTDTLAAQLPPATLHLHRQALSLRRADRPTHTGWIVRHRNPDHHAQKSGSTQEDHFDSVILATPAHVTAELLKPIDPLAAERLPTEASSAILVAFAWEHAAFTLPAGFGFLVPPPRPGAAAASRLLATTFADQKFAGRAPAGGRVLRAFFGGEQARSLLADATPDANLAVIALDELRRILGPLPAPGSTHVRRWPLSLPQYAVGHLERVAELDRHIALIPGLHLLGNSLHGVGLPDLIRQARTLAAELLASGAP